MIILKKVIDVCTRVEGHGTVNIFLGNQNEEISNVNFETAIFRGFENILMNKKLLDIPKIASRICGLCYASQSIVSCKTIENMYEVEPLEQSVLLRRLLMAGELIKSHSMHIFFQAFPDLMEIFNESQKILTPYDLIRYDPQLTTNFYELIKIGNEVENIFGGRSVHLITTIPGGVIYRPSRKKIVLARKYFQKSLINLEYIIDKFIQLFSNHTPPEEYTIINPTYIGLNNSRKFDRYIGALLTISLCSILLKLFIPQ